MRNSRLPVLPSYKGRKAFVTALFAAVLSLSTLLTASLAQAGGSMCADIFAGQAFDSRGQEKAHAAITHDLYRGKEVWAKPFSANNNRNPLWKVTVRNDERERPTLFKIRPYGDADGWNRTTMEYVAYEINRMLDMDLVPPAAYRKGFKIQGNDVGEGAIIYMVPDAHGLKDVTPKSWGLRADLFLSDTRVLDILIENPDRHIDNFIRGKHWVDGSYRPMLIDHAAGLRGHGLRLHHDNAFGTGGVRKIRARTLRALERLSMDDLKKLKEFISDDEMHGILKRRDQILEDARNLEIVSDNG